MANSCCDAANHLSVTSVEEGTKIVVAYNRFAQRVEELGLPESIDEKSLLNVRRIAGLQVIALTSYATGKRNH